MKTERRFWLASRDSVLRIHSFRGLKNHLPHALVGARLRTIPFAPRSSFQFQEYGAALTLTWPRRSCRPSWDRKTACTKGRRKSIDHEDRRLGIPSRLGAGMQAAQDRAHPGPARCECKGFALAGRACRHIAGVRHTFGSPPPPPEKGRRKRRRCRVIIGTPDVSCSYYTSKNYKRAYSRGHNILTQGRDLGSSLT